jgi:CheY-like chemotaxis protein
MSRDSVADISILVAESGTTARTSLADLLRGEGYRVFEAPDTVTATKQINVGGDLDVILFDLCMPGWPFIVDRAQAKFPRPLILAMTAYGLPLQPSEAQRTGIDHYFTKPLAFTDIQQTIGRHLITRSMIKQ